MGGKKGGMDYMDGMDIVDAVDKARPELVRGVHQAYAGVRGAHVLGGVPAGRSFSANGMIVMPPLFSRTAYLIWLMFSRPRSRLAASRMSLSSIRERESSVLEQLAIVHDDHRHALEPFVDVAPFPADQRNDDVDENERDDEHDGVRQGEILAEHALLGRFADDQQQDEVERGNSARVRRPLSRTKRKTAT